MGIVKIIDLKKDYKDCEALKGVSLTIDSGQLYGLLS